MSKVLNSAGDGNETAATARMGAAREQVEREKALKEAKASAESNGGEDKASLKAVQELLREATKRCAVVPL